MPNEDRQYCNATTKEGKPCKAAPTETGFCHIHSDPERAAALGRAGGRANRRVEADLDPLPPLNNNTDIKTALMQIIAETHAGRLHPRRAIAMATLVNTLLRTTGPSDFEQCIKRLELQIEKLADKLDIESGTSDSEEMTQ